MELHSQVGDVYVARIELPSIKADKTCILFYLVSKSILAIMLDSSSKVKRKIKLFCYYKKCCLGFGAFS